MRLASPVFTVEVVVREDDVVIRGSGELDVAAAPVLSACAASAVETGEGDVVFDLADLTFLDAAGLHTMIDIHRRLEEVGRRLQIEGARGPVRRVLQLSGVDRVVDVLAQDSFGSGVSTARFGSPLGAHSRSVRRERPVVVDHGGQNANVR